MVLVCTGLFVTSGNGRQDTIKIPVSFLLGDLWAYIVVRMMETQRWNPNVELYITLLVMGGLVVIIGEIFSRMIFTPSWLYGWVIGLTTIDPVEVNEMGILPVRIGMVVLADAIYIGVGTGVFQGMLVCRSARGDALERRSYR